MGLAPLSVRASILGHGVPSRSSSKGTIVSRRLRSEKGQTSTEYMLLVSVVVIAVTAAAYVFVPTFNKGVDELAQDVSQILKDNGSVRGGYGLAANNASGGGYDTAAAPSTGAAAATDGGGF